MERGRERWRRALVCVGVLGWLGATTVARAQSLEEQTRRPPGSSSLADDSERMRDAGEARPTTDSQDDDSRDLRGRTADQDPTNSLDDGALDDGNDGDDE